MRAIWVLWLVAGCGPAGDTGDASIAGDQGGSPMDGGADLAGGITFDANGKHGSVTLFTGDYTTGTTHVIGGTASAAFTLVADAYVHTCPTVTAFGDCLLLEDCMTTGGTGTYTPNSAGVVTITGAKQSPITLTPGGNGMYASVTNMASTLWNGGETLSVSAAGDVVPAFSGSLTAPSPFDLTAPTVPATGFTLATSQDLQFTWTGGGGIVQVYLELSPNKTPVVNCTFAASAGAGTVPKAALAGVASGTMGTFAMSVSESKTITAADWSVYLSATVPPTQNGKLISTNAVTFQ